MKTEEKDEILYFGYIRKSTDSEDKQVSSLEDQRLGIMKKAELLGIKIVHIFTESKSAKKPGREQFNEMVERIGKGEARGIISWKIDRITRNPIDTGVIQYMLQNGTLDKIITNDRVYNPVDAGLLFSVETGMSNQFILDLKKNVKRGMDFKTDKGIFCGKVPEGYLNNKGKKTIEVDESRYDIIRKMWDLMLTGMYSVPKITEIVYEKWGFRRRISGKSGGKPITVGGMYKIFGNIFYTGSFNWNGGVKQGTHKPMITHTEFNKVQTILGRKGKISNMYRHSFAYTGFIKCGCGASITASDVKRQNNIYTYYHCVRKANVSTCKQKYFKLEKLEDEMLKILDSITILPECLEWCIDILRDDTQKERDEQALIKKNFQITLKKQKIELERLLGLCVRGIISEDDYVLNKLKIGEDIKSTEDKIIDFEKKGNYGNDITEKSFDFISKVRENFINGDLQMKKIIISSLGKNHIMNDGKLFIELHPWIEIIKKDLKPLIDKAFKPIDGKNLSENNKVNVINQDGTVGYSIVQDIRHKLIECEGEELLPVLD